MTGKTPVESHGSRRVSIANGQNGYDNHAYDTTRNRTISTSSEHAEIGPVRKKSILHHTQISDNPAASGKRNITLQNLVLNSVSSFS